MKTKKSIAGYICAALLLILAGFLFIQFVLSCINVYDYYEFCQEKVNSNYYYWHDMSWEINHMNTNIISNIVYIGFDFIEIVLIILIALGCVVQQKRAIVTIGVGGILLFSIAECLKNMFLYGIVYAILSEGTADAVFEAIYNDIISVVNLKYFLNNFLYLISTYISIGTWLILAVMAVLAAIKKFEKVGKFIAKIWFVPAIILVICNLILIVEAVVSPYYYGYFFHNMSSIASFILSILSAILFLFVQVLLAYYIVFPHISSEMTKNRTTVVAPPAAPIGVVGQTVKRAPIQPNNNVNVADEIGKYKDLLDSGLITEEEYSAKKKQLLGL